MDVYEDTASNRDIFYIQNLNSDCSNEGSDIGLYPESPDMEISKDLKTLFISIIKQRKKHHAGEIFRLAFIDVKLNISRRTLSRIHMYLKLFLDPDNRKVFNTKCPYIENNKLKDDCQETKFKVKPLDIPNYKYIEELNFYIRSDDGETSSSSSSLSKHVTREATVQRRDESDDCVTEQKDVEVNVDKVDPVKGEKDKVTASNLEDAINSVTSGRVAVNQEKTQHVYTVRVRKLEDDGDDASEEKKEVNMDVVLHQGNFPEQRIEIAVFMQPSSHPNSVFGIPWNALSREINRILTFASYPKAAVKSALLLAAEGFVYIGSGQGSDDQVKCYFCCGEKRNWGILDVIKEVHRRISPNCSIVTGVNCDNEPISATSYLNNSSPLMSVEPAVCTNIQDVSANVINTNLVLDAHQHDYHAPDGGYLSLTPISTLPEAVNFAKNSNVTSINSIQTDSALDITQTTPESGPGEMSTASTVPRVYLATQSIGSAIAAPASYNPAVHQSQTTAEPQHVTRTQQSQASNITIATESIQPAEASRAGNSPTTVTHHPSTETQPQRPAAAEDVTIFTNTTTTPATNSPRANGDANGQPVPNNSGTGDVQRNGNSNGSPTYSELGIITERPKRTEYALTIKRFETFSMWPRDHHLQPKDLAEAGFYYAGYGDCARCFYCGGGLRNWEDEDDVLVEHARWFPKCAYIRQKMGQHFVETVQELNKQYTQITYNMVIEKMGASSSAGLEMKETLLQKDPALTAVKECGYSEKDVSEIAQLIKDEGNLLSADAILERLTKEGKKKINPTKHVLESSGSTLEQDREHMQRLKEKNNQLRQQTVCKICMDKEVAVVFLPCGHLVSCAECASGMKDCPMCRVTVKGIVRAFMS